MPILLEERIKTIKPKLIFFDVDGTLLNTKGQYSSELKFQIKRLKKAGCKFAIASGRPALAAQFLFDELDITAAGCFCSGAEIYDPTQKKLLYSYTLSKDILDKLYNRIKADNIYYEWYSTDSYGSEYCEVEPDHDDSKKIDASKQIETLEISQLHSQHLRIKPNNNSLLAIIEKETPITKLLLGVNKKKSPSLLQNLVKDFPECEFAFASFLPKPDWLFVSVLSKEADKHEAFEYLLRYHQVKKSEVVAFGDSHSDEVFIELAGLGVAMGNATEKLKALADIVTESSDNKGVENVLARFCLPTTRRC
jgi:Cof subfamily protein (haloacid dehalogenase superfamily)